MWSLGQWYPLLWDLGNCAPQSSSITFGTNSVVISRSFGISFGISLGISFRTPSVVIFALVRNYHWTTWKVISASGSSPQNLRKAHWTHPAFIWLPSWLILVAWLMKAVDCFIECGEAHRCISAFWQSHLEIVINFTIRRCGVYIVSLAIGV